jgi:hypothetical protein
MVMVMVTMMAMVMHRIRIVVAMSAPRSKFESV